MTVEEPDNDHHRHHKVDRFAQLPEVTRQWLEGLRPEDIAEMEADRKLLRSIFFGAFFIKWLAIIVVATFVGAAAFGDALVKMWGWLTHAGRP